MKAGKPQLTSVSAVLHLGKTAVGERVRGGSAAVRVGGWGEVLVLWREACRCGSAAWLGGDLGVRVGHIGRLFILSPGRQTLQERQRSFRTFFLGYFHTFLDP